MAKKPEQLRLTPDERADLVAYIDGELPETHSQAISTKLTHSATARREVEMLQKTWEMLDYPSSASTPAAVFGEDGFAHQTPRAGRPSVGAGPGLMVGLGRTGCGVLASSASRRSGWAIPPPVGSGRIRRCDWFVT